MKEEKIGTTKWWAEKLDISLPTVRRWRDNLEEPEKLEKEYFRKFKRPYEEFANMKVVVTTSIRETEDEQEERKKRIHATNLITFEVTSDWMLNWAETPDSLLTQLTNEKAKIIVAYIKMLKTGKIE